MRPSIRSSTISRISGAVAGLWLCGAGAAWAGGGSGDLGGLQSLLHNTDGHSGLCQIFNITPCPIPPTVTQAALEVAALGNNLFEMLLAQSSGVLPGTRVYAGNPAALTPSTDGFSCLDELPLSSTTTPTVLQCLSSLTPLAFISQSSGTAIATQLYDTRADNFLYAVGLSSGGFNGRRAPLPVPDTAYFFYDDLSRTNTNFPSGTTVAKFLFPLTVLNGSDGTERAVPTTLNFIATNAGDCSMSTVSGNFSGAASTTKMAGDIGIDCRVVFSASPASAQQHAIFEVAVPLLVTRACSTGCPDKLYFYSFDTPHPAGTPTLTNPVNSPVTATAGTVQVPAGQGIYTAFEFEDGYPAGSSILGTGTAIGLAPSAGPLAPSPTFALCANLSIGNSNGAQLRPAVGAYYAMATSGEMLLAAPLGSASSSTCPSF
jgi:hypothetical protein